MCPGKSTFENFIDYFIMMSSLTCCNSKNFIELRSCDNQSPGISESNNDGMREEIYNNTKFKESEEELKKSDKEGEEGCVCHESIRISCGKRFKSSCCHERNNGNRSCRKLSG